MASLSNERTPNDHVTGVWANQSLAFGVLDISKSTTLWQFCHDHNALFGCLPWPGYFNSTLYNCTFNITPELSLEKKKTKLGGFGRLQLVSTDFPPETQVLYMMVPVLSI